jgi:RNA polymerase-binding transcription factor
MTAKQIEVYRQKLRQLAENLTRSLERRRAEVSPPVEEEGGPSDVPTRPTGAAADAGEQEVETAVLTSEERELDEVTAALARIVAGTYGLCEACGRAISRSRLDAAPSARLCIRCAQASEAAPA